MANDGTISPKSGHVRFRHQPERSLVVLHLRHQFAFSRSQQCWSQLQWLLAIACFHCERHIELAAVVPMLPARNGIEDSVAIA